MSPRYATPVALVLLLALLPTAIHSYVGLRVEDHLTTAGIPTILEGYVGTQTSRRANWGERRFDATDWIERSYQAGDASVQLTVVRSFDMKKLYHHPELAAADSVDWRPHGIVRLENGPTGVHVLESAAGNRQLAMYVLLYDDVFVEDPMWFQLRTSGKLLVGGRRQMTLFFVHQAEVPADQAPEKTAAAAILRSAIDAFRHQGPASAPTN